jgi:hypothetical protein
MTSRFSSAAVSDCVLTQTHHSSCIEAVASAHARLKRQKKGETEGEEESYFTSLATSTEQVGR